MGKHELYRHNCCAGCKQKGCQRVSSMDGNWKLCHKICQWCPKSQYPGQNLLDHFPNVCSESPAFRSAFCKVHKEIVESLGVPSQLRPFITHCGADPTSFTKEGQKLVKDVLQRLSDAYTGDLSTQTGDRAQGTSYLLHNRRLADAENLEMVGSADERCKKNTGEVHRLNKWSRGVLVAVASSGHIDWWCPLYISEGPAQAGMGMVKYLDLKLAGRTEEEYSDFFLSYDNMCHVDSLKFLKKPLPLPHPRNQLWLKTEHVIDDLHMVRFYFLKVTLIM